MDEHHETIRVLLVADNAADARMVRLVLSETHGAMAVRGGPFEVIRIDGLAAALESLAQEHFHAVLLDVEQPKVDALEALAELRASAPDVPVVVLTGFEDEGLVLAAIQRGAQDHVAKNRLDGRVLGRAICHAIERKRAEVQLLRHARKVEAANAHIEKQARELEARAEQLDRINRELDDFAYIASHDLKEPLRGIAAYCEMLLEDYQGKLDAEGQRRLNTVVRLCSRLENLIGDLLTYCRVGGSRPNETQVDLNVVVQDVLETLRPAIDRRGASVQVNGRLPCVAGDATLISMLLSNLVSNGMKFNEHPHPQVEIGCLPTEPPAFYVRDDGIGIDPTHHEEIFTIFRRLHTRKKYEGTGAGLTIVRKIVEAHGGRCWLESAPGAGSTFLLTLAPTDAQRLVEPQLQPPHWVKHAYANKEN